MQCIPLFKWLDIAYKFQLCYSETNQEIKEESNIYFHIKENIDHDLCKLQKRI